MPKKIQFHGKINKKKNCYTLIFLFVKKPKKTHLNVLFFFSHLAMFNWILGQIAWTIIRFEIHHLWNPDWTYAFPQPPENMNGEPPNGLEMDYDDYGDSNEETVADFGDMDYEVCVHAFKLSISRKNQKKSKISMYYFFFQDPLIDEFSIKDGGRIPLLKMTYINKTSPKPCDKQVTLYELNEERFYKGGKPVPVKGKLTNCHSSECERYDFLITGSYFFALLLMNTFLPFSDLLVLI